MTDFTAASPASPSGDAVKALRDLIADCRYHLTKYRPGPLAQAEAFLATLASDATPAPTSGSEDGGERKPVYQAHTAKMPPYRYQEPDNRSFSVAYQGQLQPALAKPASEPAGGDAERFAAAYLGFNPHDASTWDVDIVNRLVRIRSECGDQAFVQEVASLMTPASIHNPHNACCYREQCKALEARALAAEAALAAVKAENEAYRQNRHFVMGFNAGFEAACEQGLGPAAIRAQGE